MNEDVEKSLREQAHIDPLSHQFYCILKSNGEFAEVNNNENAVLVKRKCNRAVFIPANRPFKFSIDGNGLKSKRPEDGYSYDTATMHAFVVLLDLY